MSNYTSIVQSRKLLDLGLAPESASFYWHLPIDGDTILGDPFVVAERLKGSLQGYTLPCWSLADLMRMLPHIIGMYALNIVKSDKGWLLEYRYLHGAPLVLHHVTGEDLLDVCFDMIVWLRQNKHAIKK